jgi:UMF1 family MFS transporter
LARLIDTVRHVRRYRQVALYLLAHMIYADGLNTLFALGGIYAAVTFGMEVNEVLLFGIAINVTAGAGAFAFGWVDDRIGARRTILIALACLTGFGAGILLVESKLWFWLFGLPLGLFLGPAQSASRSLMARLAPDNMRAEMFGLYALSGKATAFLGPAVFGVVTGATGSQRLGMATIIVFLVIGGGLLSLVREPVAAVPR